VVNTKIPEASTVNADLMNASYLKHTITSSKKLKPNNLNLDTKRRPSTERDAKVFNRITP
jgi:hypothetical protein